MNIEEYKKLAKNKIEADTLTKKVRDVIKITKWEKQDIKEGFKETFKPLIKSQDSIKKSIDEQQNTTLSQLKKNQLALTQNFENFNRLFDMRELPGYNDSKYDEEGWDLEEGWDENWVPEMPPNDNVKRMLDLEKNFDGNDLSLLREFGYPRPNDFFETNLHDLELTLEDLKGNIKQLLVKLMVEKKLKIHLHYMKLKLKLKK